MIRVKVVVTTKSAPRLEIVDARTFHIFVREKPEQNAANNATRKVLAKYFRTSEKNVSLVLGAHTKNKIFVIR